MARSSESRQALHVVDSLAKAGGLDLIQAAMAGTSATSAIAAGDGIAARSHLATMVRFVLAAQRRAGPTADAPDEYKALGID